MYFIVRSGEPPPGAVCRIPFLWHLEYKTVLLGIATILLGGYYWAEDYGLVQMYISAEMIAKATPIIGALTWILRVWGKATPGADGRISVADLERIKAEAIAQAKKELEAK